MNKNILLIAALFSITFGYSQKQWTLKECVDHALENNISIKQSKLNLEISKTDVTNAKGNFLPSLSASSGGNLNFGSTFNPVTNNRQSTSIFGGSVGVGAGVTVFNGFRNTNTYKQAQLGVESSKYDLEKIENDTSLFVVDGYLNVLFAKENLNVAKVQYEISTKQIEVAKSRFEAGAIAKGDLLNAESTAASDLQNVIAQENALNIALLNLAQAIQVPVNGFDVAQIELGTPSSTLLYSSSSIVYEKALINRPEIERAKIAINNADLGIKIAKSAYMPSLSASANASSNYGFNLDLPPDTSNTGLFTQLNNNLGYGVGFSLNVPIFNGFRTDANVSRSKINKELSEVSLENEKIRLKQTIEQAFLDVKAAAKTFEAAQISLEAQKEAFKNAQERYNFGAMTLFDFDQVRNRLVSAESALIRSKYDYVFKTKVLQFYYGDLRLD